MDTLLEKASVKNMVHNMTESQRREHLQKIALEKNDLFLFKSSMTKSKKFFKKILYHENPQFLQIFFDTFHKFKAIYRKFSKKDLEQLVSRIAKNELKIDLHNLTRLIVRQDYQYLDVFNQLEKTFQATAYQNLKANAKLWESMPKMVDTFFSFNNSEPLYYKNTHHYLKFFLEKGYTLSNENIVKAIWSGNAQKFYELIDQFPNLKKKENTINEKMFDKVFENCLLNNGWEATIKAFNLKKVETFFTCMTMSKEDIMEKLRKHCKSSSKFNPYKTEKVFSVAILMLPLINSGKINWEDKIQLGEENNTIFFHVYSYLNHHKNSVMLEQLLNINNIHDHQQLKNDLSVMKEKKFIDEQHFEILSSKIEEAYLKDKNIQTEMKKKNVL